MNRLRVGVLILAIRFGIAKTGACVPLSSDLHTEKIMLIGVLDLNVNNVACFQPMRIAQVYFAVDLDRKSVVSGKSVSVRVNIGGRRILKKKNNHMFDNNNVSSATRCYNYHRI